LTIGYGDLRKGLPIEIDGNPYVVVEYERSKMQKRAPVMRIRFRSLKTGRVMSRTFQGYDVKLTPASVERRNAQYIYNDGTLYYFMDVENFEQFPLSKDKIGESIPYLVEETVVEAVFHETEPIAIDLPMTVQLTVVESPPGFKGDTAQGGTKQVTLETGLSIQVPLFIESGETVKVNTRTGQYLERS